MKIASDSTEAEVHDVVLISYNSDSKGETVKVGKGPNKGKKMAHNNLVKEVFKIEEWAGGPRVIAIPDLPTVNGLQHVAVLQQRLGGPIVSLAEGHH